MDEVGFLSLHVFWGDQVMKAKVDRLRAFIAANTKSVIQAAQAEEKKLDKIIKVRLWRELELACGVGPTA